MDLRAPLAQQSCQPCRVGTPSLVSNEVQTLLTQIPAWMLSADEKMITRTLKMKDFTSAVDFMKQIAEVADREDHHPDLHLTDYKNLRIELSTHSIGGLSRNDFILAAKIDTLTPHQ